MNWLIYILLCVNSIIAAPIDDITGKAAVGTPLTTNSIIYGAGAIILGLLLIFSGIRLFKMALFAAGFLVFSNLAGFILARTADDTGYSTTVTLVVPIVAGIIGGFIAFQIWKFGLSLVGAVGGGALALMINGTGSGGLLGQSTGFYLFVLGLAIVGAIMIHIFERPALILSTSLAGAYLTVFGIDIFAKTGFTSVALAIVKQPEAGVELVISTEGKIVGMMIGVLVLTIIGCVSQFRDSKNKNYRDGI